MLNLLQNPDGERLATTPSPIKKDAVRTPDSTHSKSYLSGSVACQGLSVNVLCRAADELGFYILYTPLYHLYRHLQPQTLIILKILGCPVFGGKEKGDSPKPAYAATSEQWTKFTGLQASPPRLNERLNVLFINHFPPTRIESLFSIFQWER